MAEPVNLNRFRKARAKQEARQAADRNAAYHGLTKAQKRQARAEEELQASRHAAGRVERPTDDE